MTIHPAKYNLYLYSGATFSEHFTWKDENAIPIDLTGFSARMQLREKMESETAFLTLTSENGGISLGGILGTIEVVASATATSAISAISGVYDLELVAVDGTVTRLLEGLIIISPKVTR